MLFYETTVLYCEILYLDKIARHIKAIFNRPWCYMSCIPIPDQVAKSDFLHAAIKLMLCGILD